MKEISIYELVSRLAKTRPHNTLSLATESDYDCYEMSIYNYERDKAENTFHIGYHHDRPRNGIQFATVCTIKNGVITYIDFSLNPETINLGQLYIDNIKGKNIIVTEKMYKEVEMPYESD